MVDIYDVVSYAEFMKVTAIIDDALINDVKKFTHSSTITEAITIALKDWIDIYNIKKLNNQISQNPINIENGHEIRKANRKI
jgi:6-pyruvoyl-tetrahydropterin synthase